MHRFYTTYEAAHLIGVSLPTVVNWITARRLKAHRTPGGHRRIAREDLASFLVRHAMPLPPELADAVQPQRKVLVIDEPGSTREAMAAQLTCAGFLVQQASPGFPAGAAAARLGPSLIVLSASQPDGGETLQALRADPEICDVPILAVGAPEWLGCLRAQGCAVVLARPLDGEALVRAANEAMSRVMVRFRSPRRA